MTNKEFFESQASILSKIPKELHTALTGYLWLNVRSISGEEVINDLSDLVDMLQEPIRLYGERVLKEQTL